MRYYLFALLILTVAMVVSGCSKEVADLTITSFTATPANSLPGTPVTLVAVVKNQGDTDAGGCAWSVNELTSGSATNFATASGTIPALAQGGSTTISFMITRTTAVAHTYQFIANSDNSAQESDYGNDSRSTLVTWSLPFDLQLAPLTLSPAAPTILQTLTLTASVTNAAASPGTAHNVTWSVTRDGVANYVTGVLSDIAPGGVLSVPVTLPPETVAGDHTYQFIIDPNTTSTDSNASNNTRSITITVLPLVS
jgi:subtilase family serine protease